MRIILLLLSIALFACAGMKIEKVEPNRELRNESKTSKVEDAKKVAEAGEKVYKIDDFEDKDLTSDQNTGWYSWTDKDNGGGSTIEFLAKDGQLTEQGEKEKTTAKSFKFNFVKADWAHVPFIGVGVSALRGSKPLDVTPYQGVRVTYKGAKASLRIETDDVQDYDYHGFGLNGTEEWTTVEIPWMKFRQEGWGVGCDFDQKKVRKVSIQINGADGTSGQFWVDKIEFYTQPQIIVVPKNDLQALPLQDPEIEVGDIKISNPVQAKAMKYLDKGVNLSNWLESDDYNYSMEYNEDDIKIMSSLGFKSLRVPINIDFFLKNRVSYFSSDDEPKFMRDLFMIIDKYAEWTKKYGMGLTIDHHHYNRSLTATTQHDPQYSSQFGKMVKQVVKYIASLKQEHIFFEIYNEPDNNIQPKPWYSIASAAIDSIRSTDKTVTLIVGASNWYGIDFLVKMKPFNDDNIVYAFHFYEPFAFSHQGATWSDGCGSLMNVPYPYDPKTWNTSSDYYGVGDDTPDWLASQIRFYYQVSGKNALKAKVLEAKKWAVENNVPVICNEFGALKKSATQESRANYIKVIRENLEELEIPWQHWEWKRSFGMVEQDANGEWKFQPGLKEAFGL